MIPNKGFVISGFGGHHAYRSVMGGTVFFQHGIQNVDIPVGVVGREVLPHSCFHSFIKSFYHYRSTVIVGGIAVNIIFL